MHARSSRSYGTDHGPGSNDDPVDSVETGEGATAEGIGTRASAKAAHAEGLQTLVADEPAYGKHAVGGHAEGSSTRATGWQAHAEGALGWAEGLIAHAENCITLAAGNDSHAEGVQTVTGRRRYFIRPDDQGLDSCPAGGQRPWFRVRADPALCPDGDYRRDFPETAVEPRHGTATADPLSRGVTWWRHPVAILFPIQEGPPLRKVRILVSRYDPEKRWTTVFYDAEEEAFAKPGRIMMACASYAPEGSDTTHSDGKGQHAEGKRTNATGNFTHAEGRDTTCCGRYSHAEGYRTVVTGQFGAHGEGHHTTAAGHFSHAEGHGTLAAGHAAHAEGCDTIAEGDAAHALGLRSEAQGDHSVAMGRDTRARHPGALVMGRYGDSSTPYAWHLAAGTPERPALSARIDADSGQHVGHWAAGGLSYAQWFLWAHGQPDGDERAMERFVSLRGDRLIVAGVGEDYILGVVTSAPAFVAGKSLGATGEAGAAVALVGRVAVRDNGACRPDGYCRPGPGGHAIPASEGYRVLRRMDEHQIEIILK